MPLGTTVIVVPVQPEIWDLSQKQDDVKAVKDMFWVHF